MLTTHDIGVPMPSAGHDHDDARLDMRVERQSGVITAVVWRPEWADAIVALRQRSGDRVQLGPWSVTAPLDGGLIIEGPLPGERDGRVDVTPRAAATKAVQLLQAAARRLAP